MKFLLVTALVCASSLAFAMPAVNDTAWFDMVQTSGGQSYPGTLQIQLVDYNAANGQYDERTIMVTNGQTDTQDKWLNASSLVTDAALAQFLAKCTTPQTVTVPAGTFNTCKVPENGNGYTGWIWLGDVTFAVVKVDITSTSNGAHLVMALTAHKRGN